MSANTIPASTATNAYELLSEVRALITEEPRRYHQNHWLLRGNGLKYAVDSEKLIPPCGTMGCVAGWVTTLTAKDPMTVDAERFAADVLGLDFSAASELFDHKAAGPRSDDAGDEDDWDTGKVTMATIRAHARRGARHIAKFPKKYADQLLAKRVPR